ncbi:PR domain zinc finger protein 8 [Notechis scutatus]|uniref:PR domain zinc finger protein 8 n=1 Tax=Notechis scutatus TaxID=8663 RepID=A0A6J1UN05_9SAUR|nr:PR domain zinc finger protein 8 [Notechis scutatus]
MDESGVPRSIWDGDAKAVQQCLTDIFTSVYTTCDIPENAIFGPCVLSHTSLYDSIAFVALKSTDKRTVPYIFRVDTSAANGSSEGLMWLRLVQSARDKEEQNLEAYIKNGQLFYRSLRRIAKDEELLVWYGKDLTELLLLSPMRSQSKMKVSSPHTCLDCGQRFQFEFPYVAHLRFRCPKRLPGADSSPAQDPSPKNSSPKEHEGASKFQGKPAGGGQIQPPTHRHHYHCGQDSNGVVTKPSTDFHNLARELENSRPSSGSVSPGSREQQQQPAAGLDGHASPGGKAKRKYSGGGDTLAEERGPSGPRGRLERPIPSSPKEELVCTPQQQYRPAGSYYGLDDASRLYRPPSPDTGDAKRSAFVEVKKASRGVDNTAGGDEEKEQGSPAGGGGGSGSSSTADKPPLSSLLGGRSAGSAFSTVPSSQASGAGNPEERKSAFSQPARSTFSAQLVLGQKLSALVEGGAGGGGGGGGCHPGAEGAARLYASEPHKLPGAPGELGSGTGAAGGTAGGGGGSEGAAGGVGPGGGVGGGGGLPKQSPFLYATTFWPKSSAAAVAAAAAAAAAGPLQLQLPSALTLLPPSFTSLCLPAQNWCAKCNASFRMTSDLVYHMRSHHKKEYALEPLVKRRREEKLKCPICNESFRERHHLSRHMTSHN